MSFYGLQLLKNSLTVVLVGFQAVAKVDMCSTYHPYPKVWQDFIKDFLKGEKFVPASSLINILYPWTEK